MADNPVISIIKVNNVDYNIEDAKARAGLAALIGSADATAARVSTLEGQILSMTYNSSTTTLTIS